MQDHGSDVATIVASASVDAGKEMAHVTAAIVKQLLLLVRERAKIKSGETNIDKLIKSLDEGDQIVSAIIDPLRVEQIASLSKRHGVIYAMVENQEGQMIVYFKQSEADRMQHIMEEILQGDVKEQSAGDEKTADSSQVPPDGKKDEEQGEEKYKPDEPEKSVDELFEKTKSHSYTIIYDKENPANFVSIGGGSPHANIYQNNTYQKPFGKEHFDNAAAHTQVNSYIRYGSFELDKAYHYLDGRYENMKFVDAVQSHIEEKRKIELEKSRNNKIKETNTLKKKDPRKADLKQESKLSADQAVDRIAVDEIFVKGTENKENTTILFNRDNPMDFVEIFADSEGVTQFSIHRGGELQHNDGLPDRSEAEREAASYEQYGSFQIQGASYKEKELLKLTGQMAEQQKLQLQQQKEQTKKAGLLKEVMEQPAWIDGNLHLIADLANKDNFIAIYKELETTEKGIETKNTVKVYENGIEKKQADPTATLAGYQTVDYTKRTGKSAKGQFEKFQADSRQALQQQQREQPENKMPLETHLMFDSGKSGRFIELRQNESTVDTFLHDGASLQQISNAQAAKEVTAYKEPMTIVAKGHYSHETLLKKVDSIAQQQASRQQAKIEVAAKTRKMDEVMNSVADLDGTLHIFIDTKNTNNRIYIYKDIQSVNGELRTVNKSLVFQNGQKIQLPPAEALKRMDKYRHTEKSGRAVAGQFEKLLQADQMNWGKTKTKGNREPHDVEPRKSLEEYQEGVVKYRAVNLEKTVPVVSIGAKETAGRGER